MVEHGSEAQMSSVGPDEGEGPTARAEGGDTDFVEVHLSDAVQTTIGRSLKAYYDDFAKEPIPDRFLVLLAQLESREQNGGKRES
jgi:hypothetical protein